MSDDLQQELIGLLRRALPYLDDYAAQYVGTGAELVVKDIDAWFTQHQFDEPVLP